jgi:hypothetical protein
MSTRPSADEIRRQMHRIRRQLPAAVDEIVSGARDLVDWRRKVRAHPWVSVTLAAAAGYFLVPRRRPKVPHDIESLAQLVKEQKFRLEPKPKSNLLGSLAAAAGTLAMRAGMAYVTRQINSRPQPRPAPQEDWQDTMS